MSSVWDLIGEKNLADQKKLLHNQRQNYKEYPLSVKETK